jgi:hypothetical protein
VFPFGAAKEGRTIQPKQVDRAVRLGPPSTHFFSAKPKSSERVIERLLPKPSEIPVRPPRPSTPPPVSPTKPQIIERLHPVLPPHIHVGGGTITVTPNASGGGTIEFKKPSMRGPMSSEAVQIL